MNRKEFLKNTTLGTLGAVALKSIIKEKDQSTFDKLSKDIGFNHIPNATTIIKSNHKMKKVIHKSETRGHANHGWLDSHHSFSFASYRNPERMNFGVLRVLNDDVVAGGMGFGRHPHDNMEIISIPLDGDLEHQDSMGNTTVIKQGDIQVMSAGTGVQHSEYNKNKEKAVKFLQIWLFPNKKNVTPRYDQISIKDNKLNRLNQILSPSKDDEGVWIHQNAWFHLGEFNKETKHTYKMKDKNNGAYSFIIEGEAMIGGEKLNKRDGIGIWSSEEIEMSFSKDAKVLIMEVPMSL
jgi:redox-sensitive bicupin YhaK (pirin superfamily)